MRLLYVSRWWAHHDIRFAEAWRANGVEFVALAADGTAPGDSSYSGDSLEVRLKRAIREFQPDVIHAGPLTDIAPLVCSIWAGPLIAMSWGFDLMHEIDLDSEARERARYAISRADQIIVDNNGPRGRAIELGASEDAIVQFAWGVDLSFYTPGESNFRVEHSIPNDATLILSTRKHEAIYCVTDVVDAFIIAAQSIPTVHLAVVGSGALTDQLRSIISLAHLESRTTFVGDLDPIALRGVYRAADLYVSASSVDGTSISLLEAIACGTPVSVSRIPGNAEWVDDTTGINFKQGDTAELARIFEQLGSRSEDFSSHTLKRSICALQRVRARADWAITVRRLEGIAREAISRVRVIADVETSR